MRATIRNQLIAILNTLRGNLGAAKDKALNRFIAEIHDQLANALAEDRKEAPVNLPMLVAHELKANSRKIHETHNTMKERRAAIYAWWRGTETDTEDTPQGLLVWAGESDEHGDWFHFENTNEAITWANTYVNKTEAEDKTNG